MILKPLLAVLITVSAFVSIAQDGETRTEITPECLTVPTSLTADGPTAYTFAMKFECPIFNYKMTIYNSDSEIVFESDAVAEQWVATDAPAGTYTYEVVGTMGNTIDYYHVMKNGSVAIVK
jgi:hypothetical protein